MRVEFQVLGPLEAQPDGVKHLGDACPGSGDHENARTSWTDALAVLEEKLRRLGRDQDVPT